METFKTFTEFGQSYKEEKNWKGVEMPKASLHLSNSFLLYMLDQIQQKF